MEKEKEIKEYQHTLWVVKEDMIANSDKRNCINGRKVLIEKGEIIEFRFHSPMNFRTQDNQFFYVTEETWLKHCLEVGNIFDKVGWNNKANTQEIWSLELFNWVKNGKELYKKIKEEVSNSSQS